MNTQLNLQQRQALIAHFPCFAKFSLSETLELAQLMQEIRYQAGNTIVKQDDLVDAVYLIAEGTAEVIRETTLRRKKTSKLLAALKPGEAIGLNNLGIFSKIGTRTATVIAASDTLLLRLSLADLSRFLEHHPQLNTLMAQTTKEMLYMHFIKEAAPFTQLSGDRAHWLAQRIEECTIAAGEIIFREGDSGDCCYLISEGKVEIFTTDDDDKERSLATLEKSALFGELALLTTAPRNASARVIETCHLLVLQKTDLLELIAKKEVAHDVVTEIMLEHARPIANPLVIVHQRQTNDGTTITTLKNPNNDTYFQLSPEGWFIYQELNGKHTLHDIIENFKKTFNTATVTFIYQIIIELVAGDFALYNSEKNISAPHISLITYDQHNFNKTSGTHFEDCFPLQETAAVTWVNVAGLNDIELIKKLGQQYNLHSLTIEDILNTEQRPKMEAFDGYVFVSLKMLSWNKKFRTLQVEQVSFVFGKNFVLSFQENDSGLFSSIKDRLDTGLGRRMREQNADYLFYRLIDTVIDRYFAVLEIIGDEIETTETLLQTALTQKNASSLYHFKQELLKVRKAIWPAREAVSHLSHVSSDLLNSYMTVYLRDLSDHVTQAIDTVEGYRDMVAGMLDAYNSNLSNRLNEIMKVLTIISTIFIPLSFVASYYGMNFINMPMIHWRYGYPVIASLMLVAGIGMLIFFRRKKWI